MYANASKLLSDKKFALLRARVNAQELEQRLLVARLAATEQEVAERASEWGFSPSATATCEEPFRCARESVYRTAKTSTFDALADKMATLKRVADKTSTRCSDER